MPSVNRFLRATWRNRFDGSDPWHRGWHHKSLDGAKKTAGGYSVDLSEIGAVRRALKAQKCPPIVRPPLRPWSLVVGYFTLALVCATSRLFNASSALKAAMLAGLK
jgi:hypothetical protein